jgi:hypothetical protein
MLVGQLVGHQQRIRMTGDTTTEGSAAVLLQPSGYQALGVRSYSTLLPLHLMYCYCLLVYISNIA